MATGSFSQQRTLGGGDIRRQDMPFVSNRMNLRSWAAMVMYPIPKLRSLAVQSSYAHIVDGRNVGQSKTFTDGSSSKFGSSPMRLPRRSFCARRWRDAARVSPMTRPDRRGHRCRRGQLADDHADRADAVRRGRRRARPAAPTIRPS